MVQLYQKQAIQMSNSKEGITNSMPSQTIRPLSWDDSDVIDMLGFFWRSRAITFAGLVLGSLSGAIIWFLVHSTAGNPSDVPARWLVTLDSAKDWSHGQTPPAILLTSYLKTHDGAHAFYKELADSLGKPELKTGGWIEQQVAGAGLLRQIETNGAITTVTIENAVPLSEKDLQQALPNALNAVVDLFNLTYFGAENSVIQQMIDFQLKMGAIKLKALRTFDSQSGPKASRGETSLSNATAEIYLSARPAAVAFLLAGSTENPQQKAAALAEYRQLYAAYESLQTQLKNLDKSFSFENLTALSKFISTTHITSVYAPQPSGLSKFDRLPIAIALGVLFGGLVGVLYALMLNFWRRNSSRLRGILQDK